MQRLAYPISVTERIIAREFAHYKHCTCRPTNSLERLDTTTGARVLQPSAFKWVECVRPGINGYRLYADSTTISNVIP
jgi:hypothetical protein